MRRLASFAVVSALSVLSALSAPPIRVSAQQQAAPAFRSNVSVVVVDVVVRDKNGAIVRGLTAGDFELREDNKAQQIRSFDFEEVATAPAAPAPVPALLTDAALATPAGPTAAKPAAPQRREDLAGRRLVVLLFDLSSMQPDELDRAGQAAVDYVDHQMTGSDLVAVASIDTTLDVLTDFTPDREVVTYCQGGYRAAHAYLALRRLGYPRVRNYTGSWKEWGDREDLPIERPSR